MIPCLSKKLLCGCSLLFFFHFSFCSPPLGCLSGKDCRISLWNQRSLSDKRKTTKSCRLFLFQFVAGADHSMRTAKPPPLVFQCLWKTQKAFPAFQPGSAGGQGLVPAMGCVGCGGMVLAGLCAPCHRRNGTRSRKSRNLVFSKPAP